MASVAQQPGQCYALLFHMVHQVLSPCSGTLTSRVMGTRWTRTHIAGSQVTANFPSTR